MFIGPNQWASNYSARSEESSVEYILSSHFDDIFIEDLKDSFEHCLRTDSGNTLTSPFNANNYRIVNVASPTGDADAANKKYVADSLYGFQGITALGNVSGTVALATNKQYSATQNGAVSFSLPSPAANIVNQIWMDFATNASGSAVGLGTERYKDTL